MLRNIVQDNRSFVRTHGPEYFRPFVDGQRPRATVVTCADSRVHTHALDATPDGDLFVVRNIGNQIATAAGSVEYGVRHLHTPLLLIVGHTACGAIKAAAGDYSAEPAAIRNELDSLSVAKDEPGLSSVKLNVHHQVRLAMDKFEEHVLSGELTVVGAIYDFRNEMRQGQGKLVVVNVNGEADPARIAKMDLMQGLDAPPEKPGKASRPRRTFH
jgi:carbonic anhydrase